MFMDVRPFSLGEANNKPCYKGGPATLVCTALIDETADTKTFVFEDSLSRSFDFKPGQYVSFKFDIDGKIVTRAYSICSTPTRPHNLQVTVKRVPGGLVSNWLNDTMKPGVSVEIADMGGAFNYIDLPSRKPLFLSGGSGVTPVMSMLQYVTDVMEDTEVTFVHFSRSPEDIIFRDQLEFMNRRFNNLTVHLVVESSGEAPFDGHLGRINLELMHSLVPDLNEREIFMCGPEGFMKAARGVASEAQIACLYEESFGEKIAIEDSTGLGGDVYFSLSGQQGHCAPGQTLLDTALNSGLWIESSCQQGICGMCKVLKTEGNVDMEDLGGLNEDEKQAGYILACCAYPRGPVSVEA